MMDHAELIARLRSIESRVTHQAAEELERLTRANDTLRNEVSTLQQNLEAAAEYRRRAEVAVQEALMGART